MQAYDVIVVGAGAAGMVAAGMVAERGASVLLLERKHKVGLKIRITGRGRCNITNTRDMDYYRTKVFGPEELWVTALEQFGPPDIVELLERNGLETVVEQGDRVFPKSGKAADVADTLLGYVQKGGGEVRLNAMVERLRPQADGSILLEVNADGQAQSFLGRTVVMATGGKSYPTTGSDGQAYGVLQEVGHSITDLYPALVGFETLPRLYEKERFPLKNVGVRLRVEGETIAEDFGDLELTPEGLAGSTILRVSREAVLASRRGKVPVCLLDLKPARSVEQLAERIAHDARERAGEQLFSIARAWLPAPLVPPVLRFSGANPKAKGSELAPATCQSIATTIKGLRLQVTGFEDWNRAITTGGGIPWEELNTKDLSSRIVPNLYICGELLDLDANTGGFNLQLAWSTGALVARSIMARQAAQ